MRDTLELMDKLPEGSRERENLARTAESDSYRFRVKTANEGIRRLT